ncbi:DUF4349 domain-containing protein [Caulobacter mirabilis]|nr:DUF4349 domain-containing protein [Caulobacter mirabilis]
MRSAIVIGVVALVLVGCGQAKERGVAYNAETADPAAVGEAAAGSATPARPISAVPAGAPMLAYSYDYSIKGAAQPLRDLMGRHEAACTSAGPQVCQVVSSTAYENEGSRLQSRLELRAAPAWVKRFRDSLAAETKSVGGRVTGADVTSEDLSREIVDTEARLRAMTTLRDRLQALLADRPGKLSELVEIERELARVQGEIDSTQSQLAVTRGRVAMSEMTISYNSAGGLAPKGVWSPLTTAFTDFLAIVAFTLAAMVRLIAWTLPWVALIGLAAWLFRKKLPRRLWPAREKKPAE